MKSMCPFCPKIHDSEDHDEGRYFNCCGYTRLVWTRDENGQLELRPVPEDMVLNGDEK